MAHGVHSQDLERIREKEVERLGQVERVRQSSTVYVDIPLLTAVPTLDPPRPVHDGARDHHGVIRQWRPRCWRQAARVDRLRAGAVLPPPAPDGVLCAVQDGVSPRSIGHGLRVGRG